MIGQLFQEVWCGSFLYSTIFFFASSFSFLLQFCVRSPKSLQSLSLPIFFFFLPFLRFILSKAEVITARAPLPPSSSSLLLPFFFTLSSTTWCIIFFIIICRIKLSRRFGPIKKYKKR